MNRIHQHPSLQLCTFHSATLSPHLKHSLLCILSDVCSIQDIHLHLKKKGLPWGQNDQETISDESTALSTDSSSTFKTFETALYIVEGVFEPPEVVCRVVRQSAKFVTAEEEAEIRKQELTALLKRCQADSSSGSTSCEETLIDTENTDEEASGLNVIPELCDSRDNLVDPPTSLICANSSFSSGSAEQPQQPEGWLEKKKKQGDETPAESSSRNVLSSVNPDLIARLNKMFSPIKLSPHSSSQTSSRSTPSVSRCEAENVSAQCDAVHESELGNTQGTEQLPIAQNAGNAFSSSQSKLLLHSPAVPCVPFKGTQSKLLQVDPPPSPPCLVRLIASVWW